MDADTESIEAAEELYYEGYDDSADINHPEDDENGHIEDDFGWESLGIGLALGEEIAAPEQPNRAPKDQNREERILPLSERHRIEENKSVPEDLTKPSSWLTKIGNLRYHLDRSLTDEEQEAFRIAADISATLKSEREFSRIDTKRKETEQKIIDQREELSNLKMKSIGRRILEHRKAYG